MPATGTGSAGPDAAAQNPERGSENSRTLMDGCSDLGRTPNPDGTGIAGLSFNGSEIDGTSPEPGSARTDVWRDADRGERRGRACGSGTGHALDRSGQGTPGIGMTEPVISSGGAGPPNAVRTDPLGGTSKFRAVQGGSGASPPIRVACGARGQDDDPCPSGEPGRDAPTKDAPYGDVERRALGQYVPQFRGRAYAIRPPTTTEGYLSITTAPAAEPPRAVRPSC